MKKSLSGVTLSVLLIFASQNVLADLVSYNFTATVRLVDTTELSDLGISVSVGDSIIGSFSYDPTNATADGISTSFQSVYGFDVPPSSMSYTVGGYTYTAEDKQLGGSWSLPSNPDFAVGVVDSLFGRDILSISSASTIGAADLTTNIRLFDFSEAVFSNDSLPTVYSGQDFDLTYAGLSEGTRLTLFHPENNFSSVVFEAELTSLNAVPVPAAVWLFGTALIGLVGFSRRRKTT